MCPSPSWKSWRIGFPGWATCSQPQLHAYIPPLSLHEASLLCFGPETADGGRYLGELAGTGGEGRERQESSLSTEAGSGPL